MQEISLSTDIVLPAYSYESSTSTNSKALLDGTLNFSWDNNEHFMVFSLCNYFLLDATYILPMFKSSLKLEYAFCYVFLCRREATLQKEGIIYVSIQIWIISS